MCNSYYMDGQYGQYHMDNTVNFMVRYQISEKYAGNLLLAVTGITQKSIAE